MREKYLKLFNDEHSSALALYSYEDELHLRATKDNELLELLADRSTNPDYNYVSKLFYHYLKAIL